MQIPRNLFQEIVDHGRAEYPNEACGLLAARDGVVERVFTMRNTDASPVSYRLDAKEQLKVFREMDEGSLELCGIYHSHTHSEAYPSETDRRQAFYPDASYLLLGLSDRENPVLRSYRIVEGEITEEELEIV
jgi:proteasome lid subunit RPN8/RPN11